MDSQMGASLSVLLCFFPRICDCNVGENDNTLYAAPLCAIVSLARTPPTLPTDDKDPTIVAHKILNLNMTLSPLKWRSMFERSKTKNTFPEFPENPEAVPKEWHNQWASWAKQAQTVHEEQKSKELLEEFNLAKAADDEKAVALMLLRPYARQEYYVITTMTQIKETLNSPTQEKLKKDLHTAVCGETTDSEAALGTKKLFKTTPKSTIESRCDGTTADS
uniref:Variant surface glycoprotein n=1 Tax=Trypanosoma brucei TaxID=5691 RepID=A0A1V0FZZ3_9TRYP|nr:variant surface glycoprotein [Trypanosoma brucei]